MTREIEIIEARPARVIYVDLCQHENVSVQDFFNTCDLKNNLEVYGLTVQNPHTTHVLFYHDTVQDSESEGIVIPNNCIVRIDWLVAERPIEKLEGAN